MFLALLEFEVKPGCEERFEKVYDPAGDRAMLCGTDSHYLETLPPARSRTSAIYLTLDFWIARQTYEEFLQKHFPKYKALDATAEP